MKERRTYNFDDRAPDARVWSDISLEDEGVEG